MNPSTAIQEHLSSARLVLFLGADLPAALTGLPSRADLAAGLAQHHGLPAGLSLAATAQRVMQGGNRFAFTDYLGRALDTLGKSPQRLHQLIARLPVQTVITTAYDNLLELAFQQASVPINRVVRGSDLAFADPRRPTLIKLYGDLQQRDTLVVTEDDHYGLWRDREKESLLDEVRGALRRSAVLFVGYNLADPDFHLLWREVLDRMEHFALGAYAVWPGLPAEERRVWEDRQIRILDEEPLLFLERLAAAVAGPATVAPLQPSSPVTPDMPHSGTARPEQPPLDDAQRRHLETLRRDHRRRLQVLERQAAQLGLTTPPHIVTEIEDIQAQIAEIDRRLY